MSYVSERFSVEPVPNQSMAVYQCGWQKCDPSHVCGLGLRRHYAIHFILGGRGRYTVGSHTHELRGNQGFLIVPNVSVTYEADANEPWEYIFATFQGADVAALLRATGLAPDHLTFDFEADEAMREDLNALCEESRSNAAQGYDVIGRFLLVMSRLVRLRQKREVSQSMAEVYVRQAVRYLSDNYAYPISVCDVARYVGIDRTYLYRIFMEKLGSSPQAWLMQHRLNHALELLEQTELSVTEIAHSTGFYDLAHFSRAFKKWRGVAPSACRQPDGKPGGTATYETFF